MDNGSLGEVCRVCANKIKDKKRQCHIFNYLRGKLLQNLKLITGVQLLANERLPNFICERCYSELDLAVKFRERCIFSQNYLEEMLKKQCIEFKTADKELSEELIDEDQLEYIDQDLQFEECKEGDLICEPYEAIEEVEGEETIDFETVHATEESPKQNKRHFVLLQENPPVKRLRNFYICEECGGYFTKEKEYNDHMEGHATNKESNQFFPCLQCYASFSNKSKLERHQRSEHNGSRLFKCKTCGETFLEHAAKQRHEIAHVNERPYPCLECDMIFSSVSELRLHSTSHSHSTFRCEPCNKDFTTRSQLDAHSNTYPHKCTVKQVQDEFDMLCSVEEEQEETDEDELEEDAEEVEEEEEYIEYE